METYYWVSMDLGTALNFIRHRIDKQIQPESDNVMAYRMWQELIRFYPLIVDLIDIHAPAEFYIKTARTGRCTNLFVPDADSDKYEWNREDYLYKRTREEVNGTNKVLAQENKPFYEILKEVEKMVGITKAFNLEIYGEEFFKI
jgi:thymidylate synthase (FAD)